VYAWHKLYGQEWVTRALRSDPTEEGAPTLLKMFPPAYIAKDLRTLYPGRHDLFAEGGCMIGHARSLAAGTFLRGPSDVWLSFDDDAAAPPETLRAVIDAARASKSLVAVPVFSRKKKAQHINWKLLGPWMKAYIVNANGHKLYPIESSCFSLVAIHREVVEKLAATSPWIEEEDRPPFPALFRESIIGNQWLGEDVRFCLNMLAQKIQPYALLNVQASHAGRLSMVNEEGDVQTDAATARDLQDSESPTKVEGHRLTIRPPK
jgi:hypothetical protein